MKYEDPKVFNLLDPLGRDAAADHIRGQITQVDAEMDKILQEQRQLQEVDDALADIQVILAAMKDIAYRAANDPNVNRQVLIEKFEDMKKEIDAIAMERCSRWSAAEAASIRRMVAGLDSKDL